ncbi:helix-turn-helix domain-containing protein [Streptomyces sp. NPDC006711]|uniref:helix-turn-helix domain-containing protein n=1 Tax=Streptomyces sp. NPDC006711 TaxID=3364762 RepID=UPI0036BE313A
MDQRSELSEFLRSRRARLKPEDVGLRDHGRHRRVPGLRREELAQLAGVSVAYYTRLEQGNAQNVSVEVLDAIGRALRLNDIEQDHLTHLAKGKAKKKRAAACRPQQVRPALQQLMDSMDHVPAHLIGRRLDILGWNRMAAALLGDMSQLPPQERNLARHVFLDPASRSLYVDWHGKAIDVVSILRLCAGCYPNDPQLTALVGELSVKSEEFRTMWAAHTVAEKGHGVRRLRHPVVGELTLAYETLKLPDEHDLSLVTFHAEPGSASEESLRLLGSWSADQPVRTG